MIRRFLCTLLNNPVLFQHDFLPPTKRFWTVLASQSSIHANWRCGDFLCTLLNNAFSRRTVLGFLPTLCREGI